MHRLLTLVLVLGLAGAPAAVAATAGCSEGTYVAALKVQQSFTAPNSNTQPASATELTRTSTGVYVLDVAQNVEKITFTPVKSLQLATLQPACQHLSEHNASITCEALGGSLLPVPLATCGSPGSGDSAGTALEVLHSGSSSTSGVPNKAPSGEGSGNQGTSFTARVAGARSDVEAALMKSQKAFKIAENASRLPQDRVFFTYDYFNQIHTDIEAARSALPAANSLPLAQEPAVVRIGNDLGAALGDINKMEMTVTEETTFSPASFAPELGDTISELRAAEQVM